MASKSTDFTILARVKLDASDIQKQLDDAAKKVKETKIKITTEGIDSANSVMRELDDNVKKTSQSVDDLNLTFNVANEMFQMAKDAVGDLVQEVYTLNDSLTEFKKVSDLRGSGLDNYFDQLTELGKQVGRTGKPNRSEPE